MPTTQRKHPLEKYILRLTHGEVLVPDNPTNVMEVVGILKSYGVVLDAYYKNLIYIADHQFLVLFPFFKYFNGDVKFQKILKHLWHDRINFEYAEYCMRTMMWHGGGKFDQYLDSPEFINAAKIAIRAKTKGNLFVTALDKMSNEFLLEQVRMSCYYSALGQFWLVMSEIFLNLSDSYDRREISTIPEVVQFILDGLVKDAAKPISYAPQVGDRHYTIIPESAGLTFLMDVAVPYVEAVFFRGTPFLGTVSYNAQAAQIPIEQERFQYGALYADPLPVGGSGIPPTLLMQDMRHYLPDYLQEFYQKTIRGEQDLLVLICETFQKSMFCVTSAAIIGLAPYSLQTDEPEEQQANYTYLANWLDRLIPSRLGIINS
jgi:CO2 hydration protein